MKILGHPDTVEYIGIDIIDKTGVARAGYTVKGCEWRYRGLSKELGIPQERTVHPKETHSANVKVVTPADGGEGTMRASSILDTDATVTDEPGFAMCMIMSDCPAVYLLDPVKKCIGLAHSGRRGTEKNIAEATVNMLVKHYGTNPEDIVAALSPCICRSCYEVDRETARKYTSSFKPEWENDILTVRNGKYYPDLAQTIALQLKEMKVKNIQMPEYCTCHNEHFYSYRGGDAPNSNIAWLMLEKR